MRVFENYTSVLFCKGTSGKVRFLYAFYRANVGAYAAARAFFVVYHSEIVYDFYSAVGTIHLAFFAGDTTVFAFFADKYAFFFVGTYNGGLCRYGNK